MRQLLQNLVGNALKFHREDQPPVVRIDSVAVETPTRAVAGHEAGSPVYRVTIQDNGIGFDPKYVDRIFNPFQRLHGRGEYEGTGIGLAICRKIAERHGGSITATSALGDGSTFMVTLPSRQPSPDKHPACTAGDGELKNE
jgi:signal transduction histidine kinase